MWTFQISYNLKTPHERQKGSLVVEGHKYGFKAIILKFIMSFNILTVFSFLSQWWCQQHFWGEGTEGRGARFSKNHQIWSLCTAQYSFFLILALLYHSLFGERTFFLRVWKTWYMGIWALDIYLLYSRARSLSAEPLKIYLGLLNMFKLILMSYYQMFCFAYTCSGAQCP